MRDFLELLITVAILYAAVLLGLWLAAMAFRWDFRFRWAVGLVTFLLLAEMAVRLLE